MSTDAAADVLSDLVQTTTRSTHLHSFCLFNFFCGCKITTFPINAIHPPQIQLTTFNDNTCSLRSTSPKHGPILKNVKCKAFRYF